MNSRPLIYGVLLFTIGGPLAWVLVERGLMKLAELERRSKTAEEIRSVKIYDAEMFPNDAVVKMLREIAAQLAELNEKFQQHVNQHVTPIQFERALKNALNKGPK
jgi:DNA-directed RNA polymerase subunit L